ncbi:MAG: hypothetical protein KKF54_03200, partial [Candidatus Omnitrophica bacterium]|nr:hypothetical protein [Candidatus Omnitrophota bacterium]
MNLFALSGLITVVACIAVVFVVLTKTRNIVNWLCTFFTICVGLWGLGAFRVALIKDINLSLVWWKIAHVGVIFIPVSFLHFVYCFIGKKEKGHIIFAYSMSFFFLVTLITGHLINHVEWVFDSFYYDGRPPTFLYYIFAAWWVAEVFYGHILLYRNMKMTTSMKKNQIKYFFLATAAGFSGGTTCFLPVFGLDIYPYGNLTVPLYPIIIAYAILKYQLMDIKVAVTRAGIFLIVYTLVLGVPFWVGYRTQTWFIPTFFMFVLATVGPLIYRFLQKKAENVLLAQQKHYQKILLQSAKGMVKEHD